MLKNLLSTRLTKKGQIYLCPIIRSQSYKPRVADSSQKYYIKIHHNYYYHLIYEIIQLFIQNKFCFKGYSDHLKYTLGKAPLSVLLFQFCHL